MMEGRASLPRGTEPWTSLEDLASSPELREYLESGFPAGVEPPVGGVSRRRFLQLMGASLALAGITGCGRRVGLPGGRSELRPYVRPPEELVPGKPLYYATGMILEGAAIGLLGETHMGRPTKMEGNPQHPASLGATDLFAQASVLDLYHPGRAHTVLQSGRISDWDAFSAFLLARREALLPRKGAGLRILTGEAVSPSLEARMASLLKEMPEARRHVFEPVGTGNALAGADLAFGRPLVPVLHFGKADVVASFDADFLAWGPGKVRYGHDWAEHRKVRELPMRGAGMNRLYACGSHPTLVASMADHRLQAPPSRLPELLAGLAVELGVAGSGADGDRTEPERAWLEAVAGDLRTSRGRGLVLAGETLPAESHALAHAINHALGNVGNTVTFISPPDRAGAPEAGTLAELAEDMRSGKVDTLLCLEANPGYAAPADLGFAAALSQVPHTAVLAYFEDETAERCGWLVPAAHYLESWGDARAYDGTVTLIQPLIEPLVQARTASEVLAVLGGNPGPVGGDLLREYWRDRMGDAFETRWKDALYQGFIRDSAPESLAPAPVSGWESRIAAVGGGMGSKRDGGLELEFRPDPTVWDGRYAFNAWLQETPKPVSKIAWDNAVFLSPATAASLGIVSRDELELTYRGRSVRAPAWVLPGQCDGVATVTLGYGRVWPGIRTWVEADGGFEEPGESERMVFGFDAYAIRTLDAPWHGRGLEIRKTGGRWKVACAQDQTRLNGRPIVHAADYAQLLANPGFIEEKRRDSLYPEYRYESYAWGMTIDMSLCTGCASCVAACRAENNVPVVGKEEVLRHRDMAWLRIDRYFTGEVDRPETYFQPMLCQHCEKAPCEVVCPVEATLHNGEGLNEMIYNRCIGTRYCSNNCPYKVRRFNFFDFVNDKIEILKLKQNPDVTVRGRGVMEKCSFCVQRINLARIDAQKQDRRIRDGEAMTACMQACPTGAIIFGDLNDGTSHVRELRTLKWHYPVLGELNTQPRVRYLAKLWNPNPGLPRAGETLSL